MQTLVTSLKVQAPFVVTPTGPVRTDRAATPYLKRPCVLLSTCSRRIDAAGTQPSVQGRDSSA